MRGVLKSLFVILSTWLSGIRFDLSLVGKWLDAIGRALPFYCAVNAGRAALNGNYVSLPLDLGVVLLYAAAALIFGGRMKGK